MKYYLSRSTRKNKKYMVKSGNPTIHFGDSRYSDYTMHVDSDRKNRYILRHQKKEDWSDPKTAGYWAYHILWNKPTIFEAIQSLRKKGIFVIY